MDGRLRVALVAGTLGLGGAEKQMLAMGKALLASGAEVRIYSLPRTGEYYGALAAAGLTPEWIGRRGDPLSRLARLTRGLRSFRPHIVQSAHSFANLYAALAAVACRATSIGALRGSYAGSRAENGAWTPWLMRVPHAIITNSQSAREELAEAGVVPAGRVHVVPNAIDLDDFPQAGGRNGAGAVAAFAGRLVRGKRLDLFLRALAAARSREPRITGAVIGSGPELVAAHAMAAQLGLWPGGIEFRGERRNIAEEFANAGCLVFTSESEGLPNVILEAMAAGLPVVSTPAGDAGRIVADGVSGFVVPFADVDALADRMVRLAQSEQLRGSMGRAGRETAEQRYSQKLLPGRLLAVYRETMGRRGSAEWFC